MDVRPLATAFALTLALGHSQTPPTPRAEFEVASIKPATVDPRDARPKMSCSPDGRLLSTGAPLKYVIEWAYDVRTDFTAPDWASEGGDRYNIEAKSGGPVSQAQCRLMTQALLEERFKLKSHRETKEMPVFNLVLARSGSKLTPAKADGQPGDGVWQRGQQVSRRGWEPWMLAAILQSIPAVGRPVIDKTGLKGLFEFRLDYAVRPDEDRPDIFRALQDQLGLKLESARGPVEFFVIDHIEKPSEN